MNDTYFPVPEEDTMDLNTMGGRIAAARKAKGLTQQQLADQLGVTNKAVSKWETNDGCPDIKTIPALCQALELSADELLTGAPAPVPPPSPSGSGARSTPPTSRGVCWGRAWAAFWASSPITTTGCNFRPKPH